MGPCPGHPCGADYHDAPIMGLQQFERRLERLVEGVFAKAFRSGLQPVEIGRRLTREMDLRRTLAPRGRLAPNTFTVALSPEDHERFAPIEEELVNELVSVAKDHAKAENYVFLGPVAVTIVADADLSPGRLLVAGEMAKGAGPAATVLLTSWWPIPTSAAATPRSVPPSIRAVGRWPTWVPPTAPGSTESRCGPRHPWPREIRSRSGPRRSPSKALELPCRSRSSSS
jgi:hypothetical protein